MPKTLDRPPVTRGGVTTIASSADSYRQARAICDALNRQPTLSRFGTYYVQKIDRKHYVWVWSAKILGRLRRQMISFYSYGMRGI